MAEELTVVPPRLTPLPGIDPGPMPMAAELGLEPDFCPGRQKGGRAQGLITLASFLDQRSRSYQSGLSSPNTAYVSCSRLSPHLSWGSLSMREVVQKSRIRRQALAVATWRRSMQRFD